MIATGQVQRVGYRQFLYQYALELGCTGWVRNRADGTVEAMVHGSAEAVDRFVQAAHRGPPGARVEGIAISPGVGSYAQFEIRPTA